MYLSAVWGMGKLLSRTKDSKAGAQGLVCNPASPFAISKQLFEKENSAALFPFGIGAVLMILRKQQLLCVYGVRPNPILFRSVMVFSVLTVCINRSGVVLLTARYPIYFRQAFQNNSSQEPWIEVKQCSMYCSTVLLHSALLALVKTILSRQPPSPWQSLHNTLQLDPSHEQELQIFHSKIK